MGDITEDLGEVSRTLRRWADSSSASSRESCLRLMAIVEHAIQEIADLRNRGAPLPSKLGNLSDLPPELREELSGVELNELESQLVTVIEACGGTADLNQILVGLYRKFGIVQKRRFIQQKLWRMSSENAVYLVPNRKGVYSTSPPF